MIICISGKKGSGKTWLAETIAELEPKRTSIRSLADPLKECVRELYQDEAGNICFTNAHLWGPSSLREVPVGPLNLTARAVLQSVGSALRDVHPEFWIQKTANRARVLSAEGRIVVVPDVRYRNEFDYFLRMGAQMVRTLGGKTDDTHLSETDLDTLPNGAFDSVFDRPVRAKVQSWLTDLLVPEVAQ